jgi:ribosomal protein S18 acetylase RimI-like enzyme
VESAYRGDSARAGWTHEADLLDGQRTDAAAIGDIVGDSTQVVLLALRAGQIVGCVLVADEGEGTAYLGMLTVAPILQGEGLGRRMIEAAEAHARDAMQARTMRMTVIAQRRDLIAWYERCGYSRTGATEPFPYGNERFGKPRRDDLVFEVLARALR